MPGLLTSDAHRRGGRGGRRRADGPVRRQRLTRTSDGRAGPARSDAGASIVVAWALGSGGIAAYKACEVLRGLTESGCDVTVVPTAAALNFVGTATWAALSGKPVATERLAGRPPRASTCGWASRPTCIVVAPATADLLARATHGLADDLLTNVLLTARCPVILAPAMHTEMWEHPATRRNVAHAARARA